jgi:glycosyltransferase involved in cell wall biosynthesis
MRIGAAFEPTAAAFYRGVYPLEAMQRRGHEIVWPEQNSGDPRVGELASCDCVFIYRRHDPPVLQAAKQLAARGVGIVWDTDDDFSAIPKKSPNYKEAGGLRGQRRFADTVRIAKLAHVVTSTTSTLRERYLRAGIPDVQVIENHLPRKQRRRRQRHDGIVIGWIAGMEHTADALELGLPETLSHLQAEFPELLVESVGVDLRLRERYQRHAQVHFDDLPQHMARYDIGIAPLIDIPFNAARSSIKVKEYAASSVPWLASPRTPYFGLGKDQGGLLVADGDWGDQLAALIRDARLRKRLARNGRSWAKSQTIDAVADRWERIYASAADAAGALRAAS